MSSGTLIGSSVVIGLTMMPKTPTMTVASTQLAPARKSGEKPRTIFSFSAAARVASPKREAEQGVEQRGERDDERGEDQLVLRDDDIAEEVAGLSSRILCGSCVVPPKRSWMTAWKTMNSPTEATTLASGGAKRNGRKTTKWSRSPRIAA